MRAAILLVLVLIPTSSANLIELDGNPQEMARSTGSRVVNIADGKPKTVDLLSISYQKSWIILGDLTLRTNSTISFGEMEYSIELRYRLFSFNHSIIDIERPMKMKNNSRYYYSKQMPILVQGDFELFIDMIIIPGNKINSKIELSYDYISVQPPTDIEIDDYSELSITSKVYPAKFSLENTYFMNTIPSILSIFPTILNNRTKLDGKDVRVELLINVTLNGNSRDTFLKLYGSAAGNIKSQTLPRVKIESSGVIALELNNATLQNNYTLWIYHEGEAIDLDIKGLRISFKQGISIIPREIPDFVRFTSSITAIFLFLGGYKIVQVIEDKKLKTIKDMI